MGTVVIGFTGAFGGGCSTAVKHLRDSAGYQVVSLGATVRNIWKAEHGDAKASRLDLQRVGDLTREKEGPAALVQRAFHGTTPTERVVIDGIRNVGEVDELRAEFGYGFTLVAIIAPSEDRWDRISQSAYTDVGLSEIDFHADDRRDRNEDSPHGQQVELCVDRSDVILNNSSSVPIGAFKKKVGHYAMLLSGGTVRHPSPSEILMHIAYGASHGSLCPKRQVGAVVVDQGGQVVGVGYNENPIGTAPCVREPRYGKRCYRDIVRDEHFEHLATIGARCPRCGEPLPLISGPPWRCGVCGEKGEKVNLEDFFFPDRALNWCTAIHAEVWAILSAGYRCRNGQLYTTTFPCFQCAEKITQAGIREVYFTEAYPDVKGELRLKIAKIHLHQFEGIRSSSFERIFSARSAS